MCNDELCERSMVYLTIIPWARVGNEMIDSQRGALCNNFSLKTSKKLQYLSSPAPLADAYTYHISDPWYMSSYTMACKPIKTQELQYTMASFY